MSEKAHKTEQRVLIIVTFPCRLFTAWTFAPRRFPCRDICRRRLDILIRSRRACALENRTQNNVKRTQDNEKRIINNFKHYNSKEYCQRYVDIKRQGSFNEF